jgi:nucleoside-diphosphate-sugar epimerase
MTVCVTGGAGFIGSHLVKRLIDDGRTVRVVDDFSVGKASNLEGLGLTVAEKHMSLDLCDLRNYADAVKAVSGVDVVFHLAARVGNIPYLHNSKQAELVTFQDNVRIDVNVFRACQEQGVKNIVYTSSVSIYPRRLQLASNAVLSEEDACHTCFSDDAEPEGGYGWAKVMGEYQLGLMECQHGVARVFCTYGSNMLLDSSARAVPMLCRKAVEFPSKPFVVWGSGSQTREYLYVSDCVDALLLLEKHGGTINVGSGEGVSIKELAERIVRVSGKRIPIKYDDKMPVGLIGRTADISRLKRLGWRQKVSLDEGLKKMYAWVESAWRRNKS